MESNQAAEHLQVIRTLMERAALYRRALAPISLATGLMGAAAAAVGLLGRVDSPRAFALYWMVVGLVTLAVALLLIRRQALRDAEPFWSPPTRRVARAFFPAMFVGLVVGVFLGLGPLANSMPWWALPVSWMLLYGCALHAAGFFMVRGIKLFGWVFVLAGCALLAARLPDGSARQAHLAMGAAFGGLHLAYGLYLCFTERRRMQA
jgi:hypothetical protein